MTKDRQQIRNSSSEMVVDGEHVKAVWQKYMEKLLNEENQWDQDIRCALKKGPSDNISTDELRSALKCMKKCKASGTSGIVTEMLQTVGIQEFSGILLSERKVFR